jgi:hypothetical protein
MMEAIRSSETSVLQEPHSMTSKNSTFFIIAVKTSNLTSLELVVLLKWTPVLTNFCYCT